MEGTIIVILVALAFGLGYLYFRTQQSLLAEQQKRARLQIERDTLSKQLYSQQQKDTALAENLDRAVQGQRIADLVADSAYDILLVLTADKHILFSNEMAQVAFEIDKSGNQLSDIAGSESLEAIVDSVLDIGEDNFEEQITLDEYTYRVRTKLVTHDSVTYIAVAMQDVTQLIRLNRARRDMVANISHELRTPIANIRLIIDSLFHDHDKPKRKESISSLRSIARETDALLWLVQEMADLSMIESGQAIVRMVEVPLGDVVNEAVERLTNQSETKNVTFVKHIPEKIHVLCDRDLIQRVIVNLLHNAMKWSPENESVTISAVVESEEVVVSVIDNGPGVNEDQVDRIFERFYQVDASRSGHEGTGLGLAICKHIVVAHGGRIWAESNATGGGGRFRFTLLNVEVNEPNKLSMESGSSA